MNTGKRQRELALLTVVWPGSRTLEMCMSNPTVPHVTPSHNFILQAEQRKADLVDIGLYALSHGHWQMVEAITRVMHERGWGHA